LDTNFIGALGARERTYSVSTRCGARATFFHREGAIEKKPRLALLSPDEDWLRSLEGSGKTTSLAKERQTVSEGELSNVFKKARLVIEVRRTS